MITEQETLLRLGVYAQPQAVRVRVWEAFNEVLADRVGGRLLKLMPKYEVDHTDMTSERAVDALLRDNIPDFRRIVVDEYEKLVEEIERNYHAVLSRQEPGRKTS